MEQHILQDMRNGTLYASSHENAINFNMKMKQTIYIITGKCEEYIYQSAQGNGTTYTSST